MTIIVTAIDHIGDVKFEASAEARKDGHNYRVEVAAVVAGAKLQKILERNRKIIADDTKPT